MSSALRSITDEPEAAPSSAPSERKVRCALDVAAAAWLLEANDLDGARRVLESALASVPHDVRARSLLAQVLFRRRDFVAASELYERLLCEFRGDLTLTFNLALCHLKSGRASVAAAELRAILEARPDHERARAWLRVAEASTPDPSLIAALSGAPVSFAPVSIAAPPSVPTFPSSDSAPPPARVSVRPNRLDEVPRITLPPGSGIAKDATGVVSVRVDEGTRWFARPEAVQGYAGKVALESPEPGQSNRDLFASLAGTGTAFLRASAPLVVVELCDEEACVRASSLVAYASTLACEAADPQVVGEFGEDIFRFSGAGAIVLEACAELVALPVSLAHATTVRWEHVVGWTGHVIGAPSGGDDRDEQEKDLHLARFAGNGALLLAMHDRALSVPPRAPPPREDPPSHLWYRAPDRRSDPPSDPELTGGFRAARRSVAPPPPPFSSAPPRTPPPVQTPSLDPAVVPPYEVADAIWGKRRVAIAIGVIVLSTGVASIELAPSSSPERDFGARTSPDLALAAEKRELAPPVRAAQDPPSPASSPTASVLALAAAAVPSGAAPGSGILQVPPRAAHHRVYIDGRVIAEGPGAYEVPCGEHVVRIGSKGDEQSVTIPCGGALSVQ